VKLFSIAVILFIFISNNAFSQSKNYWQQQVNYTISATLNDANHTIIANEKIEYINNSPDTLHFIWFHIWPNAYKNDKSAFSEQLLANGNTSFYFAPDSAKGYINQLAFSVNDIAAKYQQDSFNIDIIKLQLPFALLPGKSVDIKTPFKVKLPYIFSRSGHVGNDYQISQWYPKPAVYDALGWHPMPYLDQGEFYSEFGNFDVTITVPKNYLVAATGELTTQLEIQTIQNLGRTALEKQPNFLATKPTPTKSKLLWKNTTTTKNKIDKIIEISNYKPETKELNFIAKNVHDFAWFASKNFLVATDTLHLDSAIVNIFSYFKKDQLVSFKNSTQFAKDALKFYSKKLGNYPYSTATVVAGFLNTAEGMEYPTITVVNAINDAESLNQIISHELGHNWLYGILASNERDHPWMDEGMNYYYDSKRFDNSKEKKKEKEFASIIDKSLSSIKKNQKINDKSSNYTSLHYDIIVYAKAAQWMQNLENYLGKNVMDSVMQFYYTTYKFKHPYPNDFKYCIEKIANKNVTFLFDKLNIDNDTTKPQKLPFKLVVAMPFKNFDKYNYSSILPTASYNYYDGVRVGAMLHNYQLPLKKFQFLINPCYGIKSNSFNFFGNINFNIYKKYSWLQIAASYQNFTYNNFTNPSDNKPQNLAVSRFVPSITYTIYPKDLNSKVRTIFGFSTYYLTEQFANYSTQNAVVANEKSYINRLTIKTLDNKILYPYSIEATIDQGSDFVKAGIVAKQFYNYSKGKNGVDLRFFAGKFYYLNQDKIINSNIGNLDNRYAPTLSGGRGYEDYTYSDYYVGRSELQQGILSQQISEHDGFFKLRTDIPVGSKVGKSENWVMALNITAGLPSNIPYIKFFADIGTYAEAWDENAASGRFLYNLGFQLSLFKNSFTIYVPLLYSKAYSDNFESTLGDNYFFKTISFGFNLNNLSPRKITNFFPL
jgi:Peptidase family M1 domain